MDGLHIAHILSSDRWTGAAEPVCNLITGLTARGHRVRLGLIQGRSMEEHVRGLAIETIPDLHLSRGCTPIRDLADIRTVRRLVREEGVQIVHCHLSHDHWIAGLARLRGQLPAAIVRTQHRVHGECRGPLWSRLTDAVIFLSETQRDRCRLPNDRTHLIRGAVDTQRHHPGVSDAAVRTALAIPADAPVIGMVAHFKAGRGWHTAVPALAEVFRSHPRAHIILAGGHSRLVKWIRAEMSAVGHLDQTHIITDQRFAWPEVLAAFDLSLWLAPGSEGSGRALLEVMATGRPVIAGDVGIAPEVVTDGVDGKIVPRGVTPHRLAEVIAQMLSDPERLRAMGARARETVERKFSLSRQIDEVERLYQSLVEERRSA
jgi:L-malate glycosyltransferase